MRNVVICAVVACFALTAASMTVPLGAAPSGGYTSYCNVSHNGGYSIMNTLGRQTYSSQLVSDQGVAAVNVEFSWCTPNLSSTVCNVQNYTMAVTGTDAGGNPTCWGAFSAISTPGTPLPNNANGVQFSIWSPMQGSVGTVSVYCDPNGSTNTAVLRNPIVNSPIYQFNFNFTSKAACV